MVTVSALGVVINNKRQVLMLLKLYTSLHDLDVHGEVGTGCRFCSIVDSGRTQGAEEMDVGGRSHSETVRGKEE